MIHETFTQPSSAPRGGGTLAPAEKFSQYGRAPRSRGRIAVTGSGKNRRTAGAWSSIRATCARVRWSCRRVTRAVRGTSGWVPKTGCREVVSLMTDADSSLRSASLAKVPSSESRQRGKDERWSSRATELREAESRWGRSSLRRGFRPLMMRPSMLG
jgi:hypothetical protein